MDHTAKRGIFAISRRAQSNRKINIGAIFSALLLLLLTACGPTVRRPPTQQKITIDSSFQNQETTPPTVPIYHCGAWASNNAPGPYSTIIIYAKLTQNIVGISGGTATAIVHFKGTDVALKQKQVSDNSGYVTFLLPL